MKKINKIFLASVLLLSVLFGNCKCKKDPDPQPAQPAVPLHDLKAYSYFKTGTYWIYKDSATSVEDSVYVYSDTAYSYYNSGNPIVTAGNYMYYDCRAHSYFDSYNYYYQIDMGFYGDNHSTGTLREKVKSGDYVGTTYLMSNQFVSGSVIYAYSSPGAISFIKYYDNININSIVFEKVVHFHDSENASENINVDSIGSINPATDFYIAKNIGIVKRRVYDLTFNTINKTDYLIRYHIIQ